MTSSMAIISRRFSSIGSAITYILRAVYARFICNVLTTSDCNIWPGYVFGCCCIVFVDIEDLRLFVIEILTRICRLILEDLDKLVESDSKERAESWAEPYSLLLARRLSWQVNTSIQ